jgi:Bacterial EndoU nuclease
LADTKFAEGIIQDVDLVDVWKNVKYLTTNRDNIEFLGWVKTLKDRVNPQGKKLYEHIFVGKTGGTNGISGIHHSSALNTNIRIRPGTKVMKSDGFYEGIIEYYDGTTWIPKTENGTIIPNGFFPDAWDADKIMEEVAFARNKITINDWIQPIPPKSRSNIFESILSNGQKVQFYLGQQVSVRPANLNNHSYIITVFPKF